MLSLINNNSYLKHLTISFLLLGALLLLSKCTSDDDTAVEEEPAPPFKSYLKVDDAYYSLKEANATYDQSGTKTTFTIWLTDAGESNGVTLDFLIVNNTIELPEGTFEYKKVTHSSQMAENFFHTTFLQYGPTTPKIQSSTFRDNFTKSTLKVKKQGSNYVLDAAFEFNGQKAQAHFEGPIDHMQAW